MTPAAVSKVYVLYTGGTFGMAPRGDGRLTPMSLDDLRAWLPETPEIAPNVETTLDTLPSPLDSSAITPQDWVTIAERIRDRYDAYDGFVLLHGTDTLAYTASALSFMFDNLAKPVVLTGSQRAVTETPTDALKNYGDALKVAGGEAVGLPNIPEVVIVFGGKILRGCRARKTDAVAWDGFETPNFPALGRTSIGVEIDFEAIQPPPAPDRPLRLKTALETRVVDVSLFPGISAEWLERSVAGQSGVVLRAYGSGNAPDDAALTAALEGPLVVALSQSLKGSVEMSRYAAAEGLARSGVAPGYDMTPEAALTKLIVVLGSLSGQAARDAMTTNWRGELTPPAPIPDPS